MLVVVGDPWVFGVWYYGFMGKGLWFLGAFGATSETDDERNKDLAVPALYAQKMNLRRISFVNWSLASVFFFFSKA